jgi:hypothetical protein
MSVNTVRKALAELVAMNVLERTSSAPGQVDHYIVRPMCDWQPPHVARRTRFGQYLYDACME